MRMRLIASLSATALMTSVIATSFAADAPVIRSCARLSGKDKALCQWENHKLYQEMATDPATLTDEAQSSGVPAVVLTSCARLSGKDKTLCQWNNVKKMRALQRNPKLIDPSSASSATVVDDDNPSAFVKTCGRAAGKERARCVLKLRKEAREKRSGSSSSGK